MIAGFTGTQRGMTARQAEHVVRLLGQLKPTELHHGDCIGADEQAHKIACMQGVAVVIHPPDVDAKRAFCWVKHPMGLPVVIMSTRDPKPYLVRNHDIVRECDFLIATPGESTEQLRSGTWATVRYARKAGKAVYIVLPTGVVVH